ncbi:MAG: 1-(5-phosphoribosyl)-5-[(5-phosphoribosylamino)methylideneamino]imidazole-4-carboxamide isomerase [Chloroflexota bacterium]|nr:1-(5-phosphoribosyl)-5-[(5-phosphoribosylamino)methylideneamino]imidazole-4-carboxamide isomerase [Chloroflexota bacterium]
MIIYPAIDIRDGKCVRLVEGDFARETVFDENPTDAARRWESLGATWIHVVDLDGARSGAPSNIDAISAIRAAVSTRIQVGGGIRALDDAERLLSVGVDRVIIGSVIVREPELAPQFGTRFPGQVAAGLDARDGLLATDGWLDQSTVRATDAARRMVEAGISTIIYTDIRRDGTLSGPNLEALVEMISVEGASVIASGGIGSIDDVRRVKEIGASGVIIGRALYDGRVDLTDALQWQDS